MATKGACALFSVPIVSNALVEIKQSSVCVCVCVCVDTCACVPVTSVCQSKALFNAVDTVTEVFLMSVETV